MQKLQCLLVASSVLDSCWKLHVSTAHRYVSVCIGGSFWSNYSDLTRPHPKWWFSKGNPLISGKSRLVKYYNLARNLCRFMFSNFLPQFFPPRPLLVQLTTWTPWELHLRPLLCRSLHWLAQTLAAFPRVMEGETEKTPTWQVEVGGWLVGWLVGWWVGWLVGWLFFFGGEEGEGDEFILDVFLKF